MTDKAVISAYTYRSLESQRANADGKPVFVLPDDLPQLFRPTTRKGRDRFHVESLAILAEKEDAFRDFLSQSKKIKAEIVSREDYRSFAVNGNCEHLVKRWRDARRNGAAKRGGEAKAKKSEQQFWEGFNKIKDRWHLSSKGNISGDLLNEAATTRNTVVSYLGYTRLEWRKLSDAQRERIIKRGMQCLTNQ